MPLQREERRRFPRINLKTPVCWQMRGVSEINNSVNGDIGLGGIGFTDDKFIAANAYINLQLNMASRLINMTGRIANVCFLPYSDKYRLGIEFIEVDQKEKKLLADYINEQMKIREKNL